jgi:hypothetical protein
MSFLMVVFVVLMCLWLFGGGWYAYTGPVPNPVVFGTGILLPWACVAILGYVVFGGGVLPPPR